MLFCCCYFTLHRNFYLSLSLSLPLPLIFKFIQHPLNAYKYYHRPNTFSCLSKDASYHIQFERLNKYQICIRPPYIRKIHLSISGFDNNFASIFRLISNTIQALSFPIAFYLILAPYSNLWLIFNKMVGMASIASHIYQSTPTHLQIQLKAETTHTHTHARAPKKKQHMVNLHSNQKRNNNVAIPLFIIWNLFQINKYFPKYRTKMWRKNFGRKTNCKIALKFY